MAIENKKKKSLVDQMLENIEVSEMDAIIQDKVNKAVADKVGVDSEVDYEEDLNYKLFKRIFKNFGYTSMTDMTYNKDKRIPLQDLLTSDKFPQYFPKVVTELAVESAEPEYNLTRLFDIVPFNGITYQYPVFDNMGGNFDMAEGDEPRTLEMQAGGFKHVTLGKAGVRIAITEEARRYNDYNIFNIHIRAAGKALARWKEQKAANMINTLASKNIVLDNSDSSGDYTETAGDFETTGTNVAGTKNGALTFNDLVSGIVYLMDKGFQADMIIMNPLAYPVFMLNDTIRSFFYASSGNNGKFVNWPGTKASPFETMGGWYSTKANPEGYNIGSIELPGGILGKPMNIVLSPFIPYTAAVDGANVAYTNIYMADSRSVGMLVQDQLPSTKQFDDPLRDIESWKITERYALAPHFGGEGICMLKHVHVVEAFDPRPFYSIDPTA
jgi:hypothetical protein